MDGESAKKRIAALREEIARHDESYFRKAAPEISDFDYDALKRELERLEAAFPEAAGGESPARRVGDDRAEGFTTYRHRQPMQSLENTYSEEEVRAFHDRLARLFSRPDFRYVVEPKIDGIAVSLTFERGRFARAVTRGNGVEGDDITANALTIASLPRRLAGSGWPEVVEIRGEIYLSLAEFQRINQAREEAGEPLFANPRNLAAGTVKLLDPAEVAKRKLELVFYGFGYAEPAPAERQEQCHRLIREWGLPGVEKFWVARGIEEVLAAIAALDGLRARFAYATDGAVIKLDSIELQREAGSTAKAPRWAMAYKFAPERAETRLNAIGIQVGRTGVLTPVAELEPVPLSGTTVARATLHNRDEIARKDIRVGDWVQVEKAGEIIPVVVGVSLARRPVDSAPFRFPEACPVCGTTAIQLEDEVATRCPNLSCPAQVRRRLQHFASKQCLDIDGLGEAVVNQLVDRGLVRSLADIYRLRKDDFLTLEKFAEKSSENLERAIGASRRCELWRLIHGLGIKHVGATVSKQLAGAFGGIEKLAEASAEDLVRVEGIGELTARAVRAYFSEERNRELIRDLLKSGVAPEAPRAAGGALAGKSFVLTGTLPSLTRDEATARVEAAGGRVSSSVSRKTDFVLAGADPGSKLEKARSLGVTVLDEAGFLKLLEAGSRKPEAGSRNPEPGARSPEAGK